MAKKTLYEILEVNRGASPEVIAAAYPIIVKKHEMRSANGDIEARGDLVLAREAFLVLSNAERRAAYDSSIAEYAPPPLITPVTKTAPPSVVYLEPHQRTFLNWWGSSKTSAVLFGLFLIGMLLVGLSYVNAIARKQTGDALIRESAKVSGARVANEGRLIDGRVSNEAAVIENSSRLNNRLVDVSERVEERRARELDYRARTTNQMIDLQREEQAARIENQRALQARSVEREREMKIAQEQRQAEERAQRERRYYTCLNSAIDLYGLAQAQAKCAALR